ncbi:MULTISPECIES: ClC family H(+)/Cl(-) exchange transporter [unclassified Prochlorococcus]|uniref:ClC family H(+)/Cl(-) exchange transporter n=1 Tax=unclassified Prochlorococcus TaxID=2627481 RepID=UPI0005336DF7|nr:MULTISPECIES: ClC family H(+)/Cl(-) exchange transporter [unclassified Prochlorococcus]KGG14517.1 putative chloride channel [Prochlorococcus sp. MIT 0602]KGG16058.1 putative chloride channel [Prochlorococcus sp. MIT 0603]
MRNLNDLSLTRQQITSGYSIRQLLRQRWFVVVLALILTGLGAALTGVLFKTGIHALDNWRLDLLKVLPPWFILPLLGGVGGLISGTIIAKFAPAAGGSGVTQIINYLRHKEVPMGLKVGIGKLVAGIIAIGSGFPLGPEGPAVQMGGSVAWKMAQWLKAPVAFRRVIVAAGSGAGIAAVFSAPIGGFIYAIEELLNSSRPVILLLVIVTTFWADTWANILQGQGFKLDVDFPLEINLLPIDFAYLILLGIVVGLLAQLYSHYVLYMQRLGNNWFKKKLILRMTISGAILGSIFSFLPNEFHHVGELKKLIVLGDGNISLAIGTFIVLFFTTGLAAASGAPGGLFFPMLTLGGCIGSACGTWVEILTGHFPTTYTLAGMGAFVAACTRTPISAMFLAFAPTKNLLILKPILLACLTSFLIARFFNDKSIYERQIELENNENPKGQLSQSLTTTP